jgi:hypothetical protein
LASVLLQSKDAAHSTVFIIYRFSKDFTKIEDAAHIRAMIPRMAYAAKSWVIMESGGERCAPV